MIVAGDKEILREFDIVVQEKADTLDRLSASINIIAQEQLVGLGWASPIVK
jgi:hypothetical protein